MLVSVIVESPSASAFALELEEPSGLVEFELQEDGPSPMLRQLSDLEDEVAVRFTASLDEALLGFCSAISPNSLEALNCP